MRLVDARLSDDRALTAQITRIKNRGGGIFRFLFLVWIFFGCSAIRHLNYKAWDVTVQSSVHMCPDMRGLPANGWF